MFQVIKNFANSEKAVASGVLMVGATAMVALGKMSVPEWQEYTLWLLGIYTGGKTIQGTIASATGQKAAKEEARAHESDAKEARKELKKLQADLSDSDSEADSAVEEKFGSEEK